MPSQTPTLRATGSRFATAGYYSTGAYGTSSYGGDSYLPVDVVALRGSDCLSEARRAVSGEVVHHRYGIPVAWRQWATYKKWSVRAMVDDDELDALRTIWEGRNAELATGGTGGSTYDVFWVENDFAPEQVRPGLYILTFTLQEYPTT